MAVKRPEIQFGQKLRELRRKNCKTLVDLASAADYSIVHVSDIERGKRSPPPLEKIKVMLKAIGEIDQYDYMIDLAARSRQSIQISLEGEKSEAKNALLALARRCEDGDFDEELAKKILDLLKKE